MIAAAAYEDVVNQSVTEADHFQSANPRGNSMRRLRLKADGRVVAVLPDGSEAPLPEAETYPAPDVRASPLAPATSTVGHIVGHAAGHGAGPAHSAAAFESASYARRIRANMKLTQTEFAARIGVPVETVRNWEQGKRVPRGPARALLKLIEHAPDVAFSVLRQQAAVRS
jgi:putative transcriptional regulator